MTTIRSRKPINADPSVVITTLNGCCKNLQPMTGEEVHARLSGILSVLAHQNVIHRWSVVKKNLPAPGFALAWKMVNDPDDEWFYTTIYAEVV